MDTRIDGSILSGKIVLLTGAGGGIGLEAAKAFAEMGAKVLIAEIDREKGEKAAEDITEYSREIYGWIDDIRTLLETVNTRN